MGKNNVEIHDVWRQEDVDTVAEKFSIKLSLNRVIPFNGLRR